MVFLCFLIAFTSLFGSVMVLLAGIHCNFKRRKITIVDYYWVRRIKLNEIKFVTFKEIEKKRKKCLIPLLSEAPTARWFYEPSNVYNNGAVFVIEFHLKNGTIEKSNYTWLFQAKSKIRVERQKEKLKKFVAFLNEKFVISRAYVGESKTLQSRSIYNDKKKMDLSFLP